MAYGAADSKSEMFARRAGFLIDPEGILAEAHARVDAHRFPDEQLARLRGRIGRSVDLTNAE